MKQMKIATEIVERMTKEKWIDRAERKLESCCELFVQVGNDESVETFAINVEMINYKDSTLLMVGGNGLYTTSMSCNTQYPEPHELCGMINSTVGKMSGYPDFIDIDYIDKQS